MTGPPGQDDLPGAFLRRAVLRRSSGFPRPSWSGRFTRYSGNPDHPHTDVYVMSANGNEKTKVSGEKGGRSPAWAPPVAN
jgi:Tol biopolymer transport system component